MSNVHKPATAGKETDLPAATPTIFIEKFLEAVGYESSRVELDANTPDTEYARLPQSAKMRVKRGDDE